ncbi:MAG: hypothetical protein EHM63_01905 [Actinobacteria bacterium]|nr:MAG: hypothetical protein EHM63_01905 [Actinomycetota bacterium]
MRAEQFRVCLGDNGGAIARLLPVVRRSYEDIPTPPDIPAREERRYLFGAVVEVLSNLARVRPIVVMLDDVQWADEHSLGLLEFLAARLPDLPIFVAATYARDGAVPASLRDTLMRLQRRTLVRTIVLDDLAAADVEALLMTISGSPPPPDVVSVLYQATQGNPFFLGEVMRQLAEEGLLVAGAGWETLRPHDINVPESVRLTIENRLESLHDGTRRLLTTVALLGRDFGFELLEALRELPEIELVDALDEAERARIITSAVDGDSVRFSFAHNLIRKTLADETTLVTRQRLHARLADALEQVNATALPEHAAAIAYHLENAGRWADPDRTIRFLVMAGERALGAAAYVEAIAYFERAWERLGDDAIATRARVLEGMGTAERSLGHLDAALNRWGSAIDAMEEDGDALSVARLCLSAAIQLALWRRGDQTMRLLDRGLLALGDRPSAYRAGFCALAGQLASQAGDYDRAEDAFREAIDVARAHDDDGMLGLALYSQAAHHFQYHQYLLTLEEGRESIEHLRRAGDLWNLANVLGYLGTSLGWLGRFDEAAEIGREGLALAERLGNWPAYFFAEQSQTFREIGRHPEAVVLEQRGRYALELGDEMGVPWMMSVGHTRVGLAMFWAGRWDVALAEFEEAARLEGRSAAGGHLGRLFLMHAYLGDRVRALELINSARPEFPVRGQPNSATKWGLAAAAVEAFSVLGATDEAAALYDAMVELAATGSLMRSWDYRLLDTLCGISAACSGDWARAEEHYQNALLRASELPMRLERVDALRFYSWMLRSRGAAGDREDARAMLAQAIDG